MCFLRVVFSFETCRLHCGYVQWVLYSFLDVWRSVGELLLVLASTTVRSTITLYTPAASSNPPFRYASLVLLVVLP